MTLARLFESDRFVVVDKPEGWLSVPSRMGVNDDRDCVGLALQEELGRRVFPCHRLDEPVSGALLFALDADAHRAAGGWFEHGHVRKTYQAITAPTALPWEEGDPFGPRPHDLPADAVWVEWSARLAKGKRRAYVHNAAGKESRTRARIVERAAAPRDDTPAFLRWDLQPLTGRPHQLRIELARRGFPIRGDALYGSRETWTGMGIALRAVVLDFSSCPSAPERGLPREVRADPILVLGEREGS